MRYLVLLFVLALLAVGAVGVRADSVQLHSQAVVGGSEITLGDVAELDGPTARTLGSLVVGRFPGSATEVTVTFDTVHRHMEAAAVNLAALAVRGARSCRVVNAAADDVTTPAPAALPVPVPAVVAAPATPTVSPDAVAVPTVSQRITDQLERLTAADPDALAVTFRGDADVAAWLNGPAPAGDVEITLESRTGLGRVPVRVRRFADDGRVHEARLTADVVQRVGVVVVTAPIRRGDRFTVQNVAVQAVDLDRGHGTPVVDLNDVLGRAASAALRVGTPVIDRHLAPDVLVKRGDLVTVTVRRGRLSIRTVGRATEDGERNTIIALRNDATREQFYATVTGPRRAAIEADDTAPR